MVDCGADWLGRLEVVAPTAIVLTHAHADHAAGLAHGADCPVHATGETWSLIDRFPLADRHEVHPRQPFRIGVIGFEAFTVEHSLRAPAVGYRIACAGVSVFYVPDLAVIRERSEALRGAALYIGDGATVMRSMVRQRDGGAIGHVPIFKQLQWCREEGVKRAIFTHCGSEIVRGDARVISTHIRKLGLEEGVEASVADDGLTLALS